METKTKIIIGVALVGAGGIGYLIYRQLQDSKLPEKRDMEEAEDRADLLDQIKPDPLPPPPGNSTPKPKPKADSGFPLKMGSKGQLVRDVQEALVKKYGPSILKTPPGIDGDYGPDLFNALQSKNLPTWIDSLAYTKIMSINTSPGKTDPGKPKPKPTKDDPSKDESLPVRVANYLHSAVSNDKVFWAIDALKRIKNKGHFMAVSTEFKKDMSGWSYKTIVNALKDQFLRNDYYPKILDQYKRIGLTFDGSTWAVR